MVAAFCGHAGMLVCNDEYVDFAWQYYATSVATVVAAHDDLHPGRRVASIEPCRTAQKGYLCGHDGGVGGKLSGVANWRRTFRAGHVHHVHAGPHEAMVTRSIREHSDRE